MKKWWENQQDGMIFKKIGIWNTLIFINLASIWKIDYAENLNFLFNQFILR